MMFGWLFGRTRRASKKREQQEAQAAQQEAVRRARQQAADERERQYKADLAAEQARRINQIEAERQRSADYLRRAREQDRRQALSDMMTLRAPRPAPDYRTRPPMPSRDRREVEVVTREVHVVHETTRHDHAIGFWPLVNDVQAQPEPVACTPEPERFAGRGGSSDGGGASADWGSSDSGSSSSPNND